MSGGAAGTKALDIAKNTMSDMLGIKDQLDILEINVRIL